ncbi:Ribosomal protein S11 [Trinorchestia longiramus]|nr:Ribosomal protein S11 [Trinorchestia longiramus]
MFGVSRLSILSYGVSRSLLKCEQATVLTGKFPSILPTPGWRPLWTAPILSRNYEKRTSLKVKTDDGAQGEYSFTVMKDKLNDMYPDENTPNMLFDGVKFSDLHLLKIRITKNNTVMSVTDAKGKLIMNRSCRSEGFRHARKKTTIAAQATGMSLGTLMMQAGIKTVRAAIRGMGPGRIAGIKGIALSGVNVVAIADVTEINYTNDPRPKKLRRV